MPAPLSHPVPGRPPAPRRRAGRVGAAAAVLVLCLSACGLRLEAPTPQALVPDEVESARQRTTADAVALGSMVTVLAPDAGGAAPGTALARVAEVSDLHVEALGGLYEWTPPDPDGVDGTPTEAPTTAPEDAAPTTGAGAPAASGPAPDAAGVVAALEETAASARADAASVPDPALARVLASIATSRLLLADAVRVQAGLDVVAAEPFAVPEELPPALTPELLVPVVQSEDALGMGWEVLAARSPAEGREAAAAHGEAHRVRAQDWAVLAGVEATGLDPRRAAYDLPDELVAPAADPAAMTAVLLGLEQQLAASYASLVAAEQTEGRSTAIDALVDTARRGWAGAVELPAFPGMPEQASAGS